jgi:ABC-type multidrug transport system fused ATPase/permease subunit
MLHWPTSGNAILMCTIGGMNTFFGPVIGAAILTGLEEIVGKYTEYWSFSIGVVVLVVVLLFPRGLLGIKWPWGRKSTTEKRRRKLPAILEIKDLDKHFGGIHVTNHVNITVERGEMSAIIGPNGAGKTTFFNLITGSIPSDNGRVVYENEDITGTRLRR